MKSILLSIRPEWVAKILNGEKTIEVRKKFPKDYVGWVYIYCTKGKLLQVHWGKCYNGKDLHILYYMKFENKDFEIPNTLNCKVVARFWCDKVEDTFFQQEESFNNEIEKTLRKSCLTYDELWNYAENNTFYKINISKLEVFDRPKRLWEFEYEGSYLSPKVKCWKKEHNKCNLGISEYTGKYCGCDKARIKKAPQNYCYVEGELE